MDDVSPIHVASRYLTARAWADPGALWMKYNAALIALDTAVTQRAKGHGTSWAVHAGVVDIINQAREMLDWALQTRAIPKGKTKEVETTTRFFLNPKLKGDLSTWYSTNRPKFNFILDTLTWDEKSRGTELAKAGPFLVHNTIGANPKQFKALQDLVIAATKAITSVRDFKKVLYGDVYVVGQLRQARTLAWYFIAHDDVYLRNLGKKGVDDLYSLVHELGHRYWYRFATDTQKARVQVLYDEMRARTFSAKVVPPTVGTKLPYDIKGYRGPATVLNVEMYGAQKVLRVRIENTAFGEFPGTTLLVPYAYYEKFMQNRVVGFPTAYSTQDVYEFFAECFASLVLGQLDKKMEAAFEKALG